MNGGTPVNGEGEKMQIGTALALDTSAEMQINTPLAAVEQGAPPAPVEQNPPATDHSAPVDTDPDAYTAGRTAAKPEGKLAPKELTPEQSRVAYRNAAAAGLRYMSMLYAVLTPLALWLSADRPPAVVWAFSVMSCSYLFLWTIFLTVTMGTLTVFVSISYVALLAATISHLSPVTGMIIAYLDMGFAAGLFGYALAERRQSDGAERSAAAVPIPSSRSKDELKGDKAVIIMVSFYATVVSVVCVARAAWVACHSADMYWLIVELSLLVGFSLFCWIAVVTMHMLHRALITESHLALIYLCIASLFLPELAVSFLFGQSIGVLVYSLAMIGPAGLFGYSLAVYARYKQMLAGEVSTR